MTTSAPQDPGRDGQDDGPQRPVGVPVDHPDPPDDPPDAQRDDVPFRAPGPAEGGPGAGT
jgi:hypothetical protein